MKKIISTMMCLGAVIIALTACSDDTETKVLAVPTVTLSPSSVTLSSEAVEGYTISYTVSSPADGAAVSASADASWISGIDCSVSGQVRFSVGENASDEMRAATLTLTYSYDEGTVTAKAAVVQYGAGDPVLSVDPNAVVADADGGTYSFGYSVENSAEGESVSCAADADWISGFDYSEWGKVSFDVEANSGELRSATITVSYAGLTKEVDVVQDRLSTAVNTMFEITSKDIYSGYEGGDYELTYRIKNPVEGRSVECSADVDWITGFADDGDGTVTFKIAENTGDELRYATITATYAGISDELSVTEDYDSGEINLVGTYTVAAYDFDGDYEWTFRIFEYDGSATAPVTYSYSGNYDFYIDGLVLSTEGYYEPDNNKHEYSAAAYLDADGTTFHVPSQILNVRSSGYYLGYTPCTGHEGESWYYSSSYPDMTFTMKNSITWESDYGVFLGAFSSKAFSNRGQSTFGGYFDVVAPTMVITKISSDIITVSSKAGENSASGSDKAIDKLDVHVNSMAK